MVSRLALVTLTLILLTSAGAVAGELREPLPQVLAAAAPGERVPVSIVLRRQLDRTEVARLARETTDPAGRRGLITARLKQESLAGQAGLLALLRSAEQDGLAARIRPLWISSVIGAELTPDLVRAVAARPDVAWVNHNPKRDVFLGPRATLAPTPPLLQAVDDATAELECGVTKMRAPEVWDALGVRGDGAVIAVIDTGVCWTHGDIASQVWVNPGEDLDADGAVFDTGDENGVDDDGNGFVDDLVGWNFDFGDNAPDDQNGHGSHVAGTVAGDGTAGTQSGMAPDARIMIVRVGVTFADEVDVWSAMQYAADNGADAISMSLGWPHGQNPDRATWRTNCENTIDMGTAMVIAAGNEGAGAAPDNVRTPGDVPRVITVGATDCGDTIAGFSSRGPVTWQEVAPWSDHPYPPGLVKPDVSAPGVDTKSHSFCSGYTFMSGTSMATPHVAGAVALMVSSNASLEHDEIKQVLRDTAVDLGPPGADNEFGAGRVDAFEAVTAVAGSIAYVSHTTDETDPGHGNGDGNLDVGEVVRITVTLRNKEATPATGVWAILTSADPGVQVLDGVAFWPELPGSATAASLAPHFTVRVLQGCGQNLRFRLDIRQAAAQPSYAGFSQRTGLRQDSVFFEDDMEIDRGWTAGGTDVNGRFVRDDPRQVLSNGEVIQPEDDASPGAGTRCWVTGNPRTSGNFDPDDGDVDQVALLDSPVIDATSGDNLTLEASRWFRIGPPGLFETSHWELQVSNDGGASWTPLERLEAPATSWTRVTLPVAVPATSQMRVRLRVAEERVFGTPGANLIEGLLDDVRLSGHRYLCDVFAPPPAQAPNPVGNTLAAGILADALRLDWVAPPADAGHDAASAYRIYRSSSPSTGFTLRHTTTDVQHVEAGEMGAPESWYYEVVSENGGGTSGEEPLP